MDQNTNASVESKTEQVSDLSTALSSGSGIPQRLNARGLETEEAMKDARLRIAVISTGEIISQKLPGAAEHLPTIQNVDEAIAHIRKKANIDPNTDDNITVTRKEFDWWRKCIYNAMITLPEGTNEWQQEQWKRFSTMIANKKYSLADVEAKSWIVVEQVIKLHERGTQNDWSKSVEDRPMTCWARMDAVARILLYNKLACQDVLNNEMKMLQLVGGPYAVMRGKRKDKEARESRQRERRESSAHREGSVQSMATSELNNVLQATMDAQDEAMDEEEDGSEGQIPTTSHQDSPSLAGLASGGHTQEID